MNSYSLVEYESFHTGSILPEDVIKISVKLHNIPLYENKNGNAVEHIMTIVESFDNNIVRAKIDSHMQFVPNTKGENLTRGKIIEFTRSNIKSWKRYDEDSKQRAILEMSNRLNKLPEEVLVKLFMMTPEQGEKYFEAYMNTIYKIR